MAYYYHCQYTNWQFGILTIYQLTIYQLEFFTELEQIISKFLWKQKRPQIAKIILIKKDRDEGIMLFYFRLQHKATIIKTAWYSPPNRQINGRE